MKNAVERNWLGVMQGRLLPKYQGRYQAHPVGYWQDEFTAAQALGLDCIEFILDYNDAEQNPLLAPEGLAEIVRLVRQTGVSVRTLCADYFMEAPLHAADAQVRESSVAVLRRLISSVGQQIGVTDIVIPCVDHASLASEDDKHRFIDVMQSLEDDLQTQGVNLSLETDLAPQPFAALLDRIGSSRVKVNYDIGNSAALGFDPVEELDAYGTQVSDIHIKDRVRGGGPVVLGEGDADFDAFFGKLETLTYSGPFIMQAYRDDEGLAMFKQQLAWVKPFVASLAKVGMEA